MKVSTLMFVRSDLADGFSGLEKSLAKMPTASGWVELIDGHRRVRIQHNGTGQHLKGLLVHDDALEFAVEGDPLWAFERTEANVKYPAVVVARRQILQREFSLALKSGKLIRAWRAAGLLLEDAGHLGGTV